MTRIQLALWLLLAMAAPLCAQGEESQEEQRQRLANAVKEMVENPQAHAARVRDFGKKFRLSQTPRSATSAVLVMPESGDVLRLRCGDSALELHRDGPGGADEKCGSWVASMPGPFTARAFGPHEFVVAMSTGNASPQTW